MPKYEEYIEVQCDSCPNRVMRSVPVLAGLKTRGGKVRCEDCKRYKGLKTPKLLSEKEQNLKRLATNSLQDECWGCGIRYSENMDVCPHCGRVNLDKVSQRHPYRTYRISEDNNLVI